MNRFERPFGRISTCAHRARQSARLKPVALKGKTKRALVARLGLSPSGGQPCATVRGWAL